MSRHRSRKSYGHRVRKIEHDWYCLSWCVDFYYSGNRLRHPRGFRRDTDEAGAKRFAKRWKLEVPA